MQNIILNNEVVMPMVGFGTVTLSGQEGIRNIQQAIEVGYRLIDTAVMYGNEKEVGLAIKNSGIKREMLFITTKLDSRFDNYKKSKEGIKQSIDRLGVEYVDLFLVHEPYDAALDMYRALAEAYEEGLIRAIGISNFSRRRYDIFIKECGIMPAINQIESHVFYSQLEYVNYLHEKGTKVQAWEPLAKGMNHIFTHPILTEIGRKYEKTPAQIALRYLVQHGISVIPRTVKKEHMMLNMDIFNFELSIEDLEQVRTLDTGRTLSDWTNRWK